MSLNCHYLILFKSPRDSSQVNHLARQIFPGNVKYMTESFEDATARTYGYLLCDLRPETPNDFRLRTNIFPGETQYAYVKKYKQGNQNIYQTVEQKGGISYIP